VLTGRPPSTSEFDVVQHVVVGVVGHGEMRDDLIEAAAYGGASGHR
jgi:hypothetical protein